MPAAIQKRPSEETRVVSSEQKSGSLEHVPDGGINFWQADSAASYLFSMEARAFGRSSRRKYV